MVNSSQLKRSPPTSSSSLDILFIFLLSQVERELINEGCDQKFALQGQNALCVASRNFSSWTPFPTFAAPYLNASYASHGPRMEMLLVDFQQNVFVVNRLLPAFMIELKLFSLESDVRNYLQQFFFYKILARKQVILVRGLITIKFLQEVLSSSRAGSVNGWC